MSVVIDSPAKPPGSATRPEGSAITATSSNSLTAGERAAMRRALELAASPGVPFGPNPRVGCVLLAPDGTTLAEGHHRGAGTPHAEVDALAGVAGRADGATAVVTLEPCNHTGRTGPCSEALRSAGVARVVFAQPDPNPVAAGGADALRQAGLEVLGGVLQQEAADLNRGWAFGLVHHRPLVTWKYAATLDGRSAAADGTSQWISSPDSRADVHRLRATCDVVLAGTGTVLADDARLTVRDGDRLLPRDAQPLRAVLGERAIPAGSRVQDASADTLHLATRDPAAALETLFGLGRRRVFLEGGPTVAAAFLRAGLVDEVVAYLAPLLLGSGRPAVADLGIESLTGALALDITDVTLVGPDVRITAVPRKKAS